MRQNNWTEVKEILKITVKFCIVIRQQKHTN